MNSSPSEVTVLVITYNEEANIARTLDRVSFAGRIVVVDSGSTDATLQIIEAHPRAEVFHRAFTTFADQCNFGLEQVESEWVLSLDADYVLPADAVNSIGAALASGSAYHEAAFDYCIEGRPVWGSILPPRIVLFRSSGARYVDDGHGHRLEFDAVPQRLPFRIRHDDRKSLKRWLKSQVRYAEIEADKLNQVPFSTLGLNDRLRKLLFIAPPTVFVLVYVFRGGFLSGWRGLFYALQRFTAELLLCLYTIERLIKRKNS